MGTGEQRGIAEHAALPDRGREPGAQRLRRLGDLDRDTQRFLDRVAEGSRKGDELPASRHRRSRHGLPPGTILVREWDGKSQRVTVLEDDFAWNGTTYRSLTEIAFAMTGPPGRLRTGPLGGANQTRAQGAPTGCPQATPSERNGPSRRVAGPPRRYRRPPQLRAAFPRRNARAPLSHALPTIKLLRLATWVVVFATGNASTRSGRYDARRRASRHLCRRRHCTVVHRGSPLSRQTTPDIVEPLPAVVAGCTVWGQNRHNQPRGLFPRPHSRHTR
jgi:Protein of unknown function (DUF2924)